jgi:hypothetical protein
VRDVFGDFSTQRELTPTLQDAIRSLAADWTDEDRQRLFKEAAGGFVFGSIGLTLVAATEFAKIDPVFLADELARLFDEANNNTERERVMGVWRLIAPSDGRARRTLIDRIYIPLAHQGKGAVKIALDHFELVRSPPSAASRDRMRAAINAETKSDQALRRRADDLMRDAGWVRRGFFR